MNKNDLEAINEEVNNQYERNKKQWYKNRWAFWCITLSVAIILSILSAKFLVPVIFGDSNYLSPNADLIDKLSYFAGKITPYIIGGSGIISGLIYNIKHRECEHTVKQYILSIVSALAGILISGILCFFLLAVIFIFIIIVAFYIVINMFSFGGFTKRR